MTKRPTSLYCSLGSIHFVPPLLCFYSRVPAEHLFFRVHHSWGKAFVTSFLTYRVHCAFLLAGSVTNHDPCFFFKKNQFSFVSYRRNWFNLVTDGHGLFGLGGFRGRSYASGAVSLTTPFAVAQVFLLGRCGELNIAPAA